jgi:hypothetical protein
MALGTNVTGGGGWDALTAGSGDSLTVKSFDPGSRAYILEAYGGNSTTKCDFSIRSPRLHDSTRGIRLAHQFNPTLSGADGNPQIYLPSIAKQELHSTDTLVVETLATANDDVNFVMVVYYENLGGIDARLISAEEAMARQKNLVGIRVSPTAGASNAYGTAEAINADDDRFKADKDYALLGFATDLPFTSLGLKGPDTGNLRIAAPGHWNTAITSSWFIDLSRRHNLPLVPVINSNNKGVTFVDAVDAVTNVAPLITLIFAEL